MERGLSPVISTVLLITMVVVVAGLVFSWSRYTVKNSEKEALEQQLCSGIKFVVDDFCYGEDTIVDSTNAIIGTKKYIQFNGKNDVEEPKLYGFLILLDYGWKTVPIPSSSDSDISGFDAREVISDNIEDITGIEKVRITPKIKPDNRFILCEEKEEVIDFEGVGGC